MKKMDEHKKAREKINRTAKEWEDTFNAISNFVFILDKDFRFVRVNKAFCDAMKKESKELIGKHCFEVVHDRDEPWPNCPYNKSLKTKKVIIEEIYDSNIGFPLLITTSPLFDNKGEVTGCVHLAQDISERKKAEEALRASEEKYRNLIERTPEVIYSLDSLGRIMSINEASKTLLGLSPDEIIGRNIIEFVPKEMLSKVNELFGSQIRDGKEVMAEIIMLDKDGIPHDVEFNSVSIIEAGKIVGLQGIVRDITKRKIIEEERNRLLHKYGERIKELNCFYGLSEIVDKSENLEEIFKGLIYLLPPAWQYPEITCVRITIDEQIFQTENFKETRWKQSANIKVHGKNVGSVEVYYLEERPQSQEGPFLKEERYLINAITERMGKIIEWKLTEKELWGASEKWLSLTENTDDTIVVTDNQNIIRSINKTIPPTTQEGVIGTSIYEYVSEEYHDVMRKSLKKVYKTRESVSYEVTLDMSAINPELSTLWFSTKLVPIKTDKEITGIIMIATDITERKRAEEEIRMLSNVVHQTSEAIAVSDFEGKLVFVNEAWAEMHGYEMKELIEVDISIFYRKPEIMKLFEGQAKTEGFSRGRIAHVTKDGIPFATLSSLILLKDEHCKPKGIVRIAKDIRKIVSDIRDVGILPKKVR